MSDKGNTGKRNTVRGTVYTGEGFDANKQSKVRRTKREIKVENPNRPRRRIDELREQELKAQQEQARLAEEERLKQEKQAEQERLKKEKQEKQAEQERLKQEKQAEQERLKQEKLAELARLNKKPINKKKLIIGIVAALFVIAYTGVAIYYNMHFYDDTVIYGIDCSQKTLEEVKADVRAKLGTYKLEVQEREAKKEIITAEDVKLQFEDDGSIDQLLKDQKAYIWPVTLLMQKSQGDTVSFSYDRQTALDRIDNLVCMDHNHMVAPQDAYITPTDTGFEVAPEVMGTTLDDTKTEDAILLALDTGKTVLSLEEEDCYVNPQIYQDDEALQAEASAKDALAGAKITLDFGSEKEVIDSELIGSWITQMANGEYVIDDLCVIEYVQGLADKYDTYGVPVEFYTTLGTTEELYGGDYGWRLEQDDMNIAILKALAEGYRGDLEPIYSHVGMSHENNGIGYTYIEICISMQEMWFYKDGELLVDTPVVTGNPYKGNGTPSGGVWEIDAKQRNAVLVGEGYQAPVDYWMPFNGGVGIHDLKSRYYFGGSIYLGNGSHGCVNTPYNEVQMIYENVSVGTPVIVYE